MAKERIKSLVLPLIRPFWRKIWWRIEQRLMPINARLDRLERGGGLDSSRPVPLHVESFERTWRQHLPALLEATATARAFGAEGEQLKRRIEALEANGRRFDAQLGAAFSSLAAARTTVLRDMRIVPEGLGFDPAAWPDGVRLLFCGPEVAPAKGMINIGTSSRAGIDLISSGLDLPFAESSVREIHAVRFADGMSALQLEQRVLPYWRRLLEPGGELRMLVLDAAACARAVASGELSLYEWRSVMFADEAAGANSMHWPEALIRTVESAGFQSVQALTIPRGCSRMPLFELKASRA